MGLQEYIQKRETAKVQEEQEHKKLLEQEQEKLDAHDLSFLMPKLRKMDLESVHDYLEKYIGDYIYLFPMELAWYLISRYGENPDRCSGPFQPNR